MERTTLILNRNLFNIINVFTVIFDQFNASLLNKNVNLLKQTITQCNLICYTLFTSRVSCSIFSQSDQAVFQQLVLIGWLIDSFIHSVVSREPVGNRWTLGNNTVPCPCERDCRNLSSVCLRAHQSQPFLQERGRWGQIRPNIPTVLSRGSSVCLCSCWIRYYPRCSLSKQRQLWHVWIWLGLLLDVSQSLLSALLRCVVVRFEFLMRVLFRVFPLHLLSSLVIELKLSWFGWT